jgi:hypothetical protein
MVKNWVNIYKPIGFPDLNYFSPTKSQIYNCGGPGVFKMLGQIIILFIIFILLFLFCVITKITIQLFVILQNQISQ